MRGQKYMIETDGFSIPGQIVMKDDEVSGYVLESFGHRATFMLFRPEEMPEGATVLAEEVSQEEVMGSLKEIVDSDPGMREMWMNLLRKQTRYERD